MSTFLSRHFTARRLERGLRPVDLAGLCGYRNRAKGANRIMRFEERGEIHPELLAKLAVVLGVEQEQVAELVRQDQEAFRAAWNRWANEPVPMMIYRRRLPSFAAYWHLPEEITTEAEAVEFACHQARNGSGPLLLLVNRRESIEIDEDGVVLGRFTRSPENSLPYQRLGRHTFRFTLGPSGLQIEPSTEPRP